MTRVKRGELRKAFLPASSVPPGNAGELFPNSGDAHIVGTERLSDGKLLFVRLFPLQKLPVMSECFRSATAEKVQAPLHPVSHPIKPLIIRAADG